MNIFNFIRIDSGSITILILAVIFFLFALSLKKEKNGYYIRNISGEELHAIITANKNIKIIDLRSEKEFYEKHIENAINIPIDEFENKIREYIPETSETIVIYCKNGIRCKVAKDILKQLGYTQIYILGSMDKYFNRLT